MSLIALTGKKRSGKTLAASYLDTNYDFIKANFKDSLVEEVKRNFPELLVGLEHTYGEDLETLLAEKPPLMRSLLQNYGTNVRRHDDPNYWVTKWVGKVEPLLPEYDVVVDDVRFLNEAKAVKSLGGKIIRIEREGLTSNDTHISELEMDQITPDRTITVGDGEFEKLYQELDKEYARR